MKYSNLIFDLDGTLSNPEEGLLNSLQYALRGMHYTPIPTEVPRAFVGPPLQKSFSELFGFNEDQIKRAIELFREYYKKAGLFENNVYDGIPELLESLMDEGIKLFVATSKYKEFAWKVLEHFELDKYFTDLAGTDYGGTLTKGQLIEELITKYRLTPSETLMIGDTKFDLIGAQDAGVDALALGYGFGEKDLLLSYNPVFYAETVKDLSDYFFDLSL